MNAQQGDNYKVAGGLVLREKDGKSWTEPLTDYDRVLRHGETVNRRHRSGRKTPKLKFLHSLNPKRIFPSPSSRESVMHRKNKIGIYVLNRVYRKWIGRAHGIVQ